MPQSPDAVARNVVPPLNPRAAPPQFRGAAPNLFAPGNPYESGNYAYNAPVVGGLGRIEDFLTQVGSPLRVDPPQQGNPLFAYGPVGELTGPISGVGALAGKAFRAVHPLPPAGLPLDAEQLAARIGATTPAQRAVSNDLAAQVAARGRQGLGGTGGNLPLPPAGPEFSFGKFPEAIQPKLAETQAANAGAIQAVRPRITQAETQATADAMNAPIWKIAQDVPKPGELTAQLKRLQDETANILGSTEQFRVKIDAGTATPADRLAYAAQLKVAAFGRTAEIAGRGEAGRALHGATYSVTPEAGGQSAKLISAVIDATVKNHPEKIDQIAEAIAALGNEPAKLTKLFRDMATQPSFWDKFDEYYRSNVLWNVATHITNTTSGIYQIGLLGARETAKSLGAAVLTRDASALKQIPAFWKGVLRGYAGAFDNLPELLRSSEFVDKQGGVPHFGGAIVGPRIPGTQVTLGDIIRTPYKLLTVADLFQTKPMYNGLLSQYLEKAGNATPEVLAKLQQKAFAEAEQFALHEGGKVTSALSGLRESAPILKPLVLFIKTPYNLTKMGLRFSPPGALRLLTEGGRKSVADVVTEATIGSTVLAGFYSMLASDNMTGLNPKSTAEKQLWEAEGRGPLMIRATEYPMIGPLLRIVYGDKADKTWVSGTMLGPLLFPALMASATYEVTSQGENLTADKALIAAGNAGNTILNTLPLFQSYAGINNILSSPSVDTVNRFLVNLAKPLIPMESGLSMVERMMDGLRREPKTFLEGLQALIPGAAESIRPVRDVLGRPVPVAQGPAGLLPKSTVEDVSNPVLAEDRNLRSQNPNFVGLTKPTDTIGSGDKKIQLTPDQLDRYEALAGPAKETALTALIQSPKYQAATIAEKSKMFESTETRAQQAALRGLGIEIGSNSKDPANIVLGARLAIQSGDNYQQGKSLAAIGQNLTPEIKAQVDALRANGDKAKAAREGKSYEPSVDELLHGADLVSAWVKAPEFIFGDKATWDRAARGADLLRKLRNEDEVQGKNPAYDSELTKFYYSVPGLATFYTISGSPKSDYVSRARQTIEKDLIWRYFDSAAHTAQNNARTAP